MNVVIFTGSAWIDPDEVNDTDADIYPVLRSIGAYQVASILRNEGYTVKVIDYFPYLLNYRYADLISLIERYINSETLWVGYSTTFFDGYDASTMHPLRNEKIYSLKDKILSINNKIKTVVGGAKAWKKEFDDFTDFYIEGYADSTVVGLTKYIEGKNPFFQINYKSVISDRAASNFNFSNYSFTWDNTDAINSNECLPIEIARGCIFKCSYCSYPLNGKKKLDFIKSPEILLSEFRRNYELYGVDSYMYADDTHNDSLDKLKYLYDEVYSKLSFKIKFSAYLRLDLLRAHPEMIPLLRESGLRSCFFGIESLNYASNKTVGKGMQTTKIIETLHLLRNEWPDVFMQGAFIVGLPNESENSVKDWLSIISDESFPLDRVTLNPLHLYKDQGESGYWFNDIENNPEKYGYVFSNNNEWTNNTGLTKQRSIQIVKDAGKILQKLGKNKFTWFTDWRLQNLGISRDQRSKLCRHARSEIVREYIEQYIKNQLTK
jgi:radical SAM superfamily enzyme YgiQ (UPF0313 family)